MFMADVVNIRAENQNLDPITGKLMLAETNPLVYVHGNYYELGSKIGKPLDILLKLTLLSGIDLGIIRHGNLAKQGLH